MFTAEGSSRGELQSGQSLSFTEPSLHCQPVHEGRWGLSPVNLRCLLPKRPVFQEEGSAFLPTPQRNCEDGAFSDRTQKPMLNHLISGGKQILPLRLSGDRALPRFPLLPLFPSLRTVPGFETTETLDPVWEKHSLF